MRKRQHTVGITFNTSYTDYERLRRVAMESSMSASELIRTVLAKALDEIQEKGGTFIDE